MTTACPSPAVTIGGSPTIQCYCLHCAHPIEETGGRWYHTEWGAEPCPPLVHGGPNDARNLEAEWKAHSHEAPVILPAPRAEPRGWWIVVAIPLVLLWILCAAAIVHMRAEDQRHASCLAAIVDYQDSYQAITSSLTHGPAPSRGAVQLKADTDRDVAACQA